MTSPIGVSSRLLPATRSLLVAAAFALLPSLAHAQGSGKWVATISQIKSVGGSAELRVDPRNEKQSRAKLSIRNSKRETKFAWDINVGRCNDDGPRIAALAAFTALQGGMDGGGEISNNIPKLESGKVYYVRIFEAGTTATDASAWACADIAELP